MINIKHKSQSKETLQRALPLCLRSCYIHMCDFSELSRRNYMNLGLIIQD